MFKRRNRHHAGASKINMLRRLYHLGAYVATCMILPNDCHTTHMKGFSSLGKAGSSDSVLRTVSRLSHILNLLPRGEFNQPWLQINLRTAMRKASRLWRRLRGGRSDKTQVADDATGDSSNLNSDSQESALPVAVHSDASDPLLAPERDDRDTAEAMWLDAYKKLEEGQETREMVIAYEKLLGQQLNGE